MSGYRIVLVDDDQQIVASLSQLLETAGHSVVGKGTTGAEAIWLNQKLQPDVVILDLQMPGMDGLEAAAGIMSTRPTPIVVCTSYYEDALVNSAASAGVHAYVVKPCRVADLVPAINVAVSRFVEAQLLKGEVVDLKERLESRKLVEQAKGIVMRSRGISEEQAHRYLQTESQRQSKRIVDLARAIVLADQTLNSVGVSETNGKKRSR